MDNPKKDGRNVSCSQSALRSDSRICTTFRYQKQADAYIDVTGIDKSSHAVRTMSEKEQGSCENPFVIEEF